MSRASDVPWWFYVVLLILVCGCNVGWYLHTDAGCKERGGHTEFIWGDSVSWTCAEADR